jgi:hypothetical protein
MPDPCRLSLSLPAPRFAADTAGRRGALSSRSSPYLKPSEGDLQLEPSPTLQSVFWPLVTWIFPGQDSSAFPNGQPELVLGFFLAFSNGLPGSCFLVFFFFF